MRAGRAAGGRVPRPARPAVARLRGSTSHSAVQLTAARQGGAVVAAHPFRWEPPFDVILRKSHPAAKFCSELLGKLCRLPEPVRKNDAFAPLRGRDDFKKLLAELKK